MHCPGQLQRQICFQREWMLVIETFPLPLVLQPKRLNYTPKGKIANIHPGSCYAFGVAPDIGVLGKPNYFQGG